MIFSLETLQAKKGDSIILHYSDDKKNKLAIFDGGPGIFSKYNTYEKSLRPRLLKIKKELKLKGPLIIDLIVVTHIDDDHIFGIIELLKEIKKLEEDGKTPLFEVKKIWFNSFGNISWASNFNLKQFFLDEKFTILKETNDTKVKLSEESRFFMYGVGQGNQLTELVKQLKIPINLDFPKSPSLGNKFASLQKSITNIQLGKNIDIKIISPNETRLKGLKDTWNTRFKLLFNSNSVEFINDIVDRRYVSPANLSSIVTYIECGTKSILLTGDALDDDIIDGLKFNGLLDKNGKIMVDIMQVPHHGSDQNVSTKFFKRIRAKNYIISSDGSNNNPDLSTLNMISEGTKGRNNFTIHLTNKTGEDDLKDKLNKFIRKEKRNGRKYLWNFIPKRTNSIVLNLKETLKY